MNAENLCIAGEQNNNSTRGSGNNSNHNNSNDNNITIVQGGPAVSLQPHSGRGDKYTQTLVLECSQHPYSSQPKVKTTKDGKLECK